MNFVYEKEYDTVKGWWFNGTDGMQGPYDTEKEALAAFRNYFKSCPTCED